MKALSLNPFSADFQTAVKDSELLPNSQRILCIFLAVITGVFLVVPGLIVYRTLIDHFLKQLKAGDNAAADKTNKIWKRMLAPSKEDLSQSVYNDLLSGFQKQANFYEKRFNGGPLIPADETDEVMLVLRDLAIWYDQLHENLNLLRSFEQEGILYKSNMTLIKYEDLFKQLKGKIEAEKEIILSMFDKAEKIAEGISNEEDFWILKEYEKIVTFINESMNIRTPKVEEIAEHEKKLPLVGIDNIGNSCYLNSCVQVLFNTSLKRLINQKRSAAIPEELAHQNALKFFYGNYRGTENWLSLVDAAQLLRYAAFSDETRLVASFQESELFNQQDAAELLNVLLQALGCHFQEIVVNDCLSDTTYNIEHQQMMSLGLKGNETHISSAFKRYRREKINDPNNKWNGYDKYTKERYIESAPETLVVQLNRFIFDKATKRARKIGSNIEIPDEMDLSFLLDGDAEARYRVAAYINHHGNSIKFGHYTANVKVGDQWFTCDDEEISPSKRESKDRGQAYIIVLEKI